MGTTDVLLLVVAGLAAGLTNAVAGGGSLITFPALLATGLPPVAANVTNSVSVFPGYLASVVGSRRDLPDRRRLLPLLPTALLGTGVGCVLLLATPPRAFDVVVPFLVLGAAAVLAFQDRLKAVVGHPRDMSPRRRALALHAAVGLGCVYGGYFGAALGIILLACLGLILDEPMARLNARKQLISAVCGGVTVVAFALFGPVHWWAVLILTPATAVGGYVGARLARRLPARILKATIVVLATAVGIVLLTRI